MLALSVTTLLTSISTFRFSAWERPKLILGFFLFFFCAELAAETWLIPEGAFGPGLVWVCFALSLPFIAASVLSRHFRSREPRGVEEPEA